MAEIDQMQHAFFTKPEILAALRRQYEEQIEKGKTRFEDLELEKEQLYAEELARAKRHLLLVEKAEVINSFHRGIIGRAIQDKLLADIDSQILKLESGIVEDTEEK